MVRKKNLGQYFTPEHVAEFMIDLIESKKTAKVLEPSCGEGIFMKLLENRGYKNVTGYEIDKTIEPLVTKGIHFESFVGAKIRDKYDLVIGNPPYIRWKNLDSHLKKELQANALWKKYFNSLSDYLNIFILKSVELLKDQGELIFITPEYWLNTKHSESLRNYLVEEGYFTDIIHFNETPIFDKVASSIVIFRYVKSAEKNQQKQIHIRKYHSRRKLDTLSLKTIKKDLSTKDIDVFNRIQFRLGERWVLAPDTIEKKLRDFEAVCRNGLSQETTRSYVSLGDIADIGNGMVSGLDKVFQIPKDTILSKTEMMATIPVVKAKSLSKYTYDDTTRYIFPRDSIKNEAELRATYPNFYALLSPEKKALKNRYNYNKAIPYWEWVFPRNLKLFDGQQKRIFVPCKERISHKNYVRFSYAKTSAYATQDVTAIFLKKHIKEDVHYILALLNSPQVFEWLIHKGTVKGNIVEFSEKPLASIPIRLIDWSRPKEVNLHNEISSLCKSYIRTKDEKILTQLEKKVSSLF